MNLEETLYDLVSKRTKPVFLWASLCCIYFFIMYQIPRFFNRIKCQCFGCVIKGGHGGFNLPDDAYSYWCIRCGAVDSNYEGETDFKIVRKGDNLFGRR
jgi:hypothetical protein